MKRTIFFLLIAVLAGTVLFYNCKKKEYARLNPLDPLYSGAVTETNGGTTIPGGPTYNTGVITFNSNSYVSFTNFAKITLTDADLTVSTQEVGVKSTTDNAGITVRLAKAVSTYTGTVGFTNNASVAGRKIRVSHGDTVTVTYNDANPAGARTDTATWTSNVPVQNLYVYDDNLQYPATGFMGQFDGSSLTITAQSSDRPQSGSSCWKIVSNGTETWAGIYLQYTGNWRIDQPAGPFADLSDYNTLVFWARMGTASKVIDQMGMGDTSGAGDSSGQRRINNTTVTTDWQRFTVDLSAANMSSINGMFYFSENGGAYTLYFDNVYYTNQ